MLQYGFFFAELVVDYSCHAITGTRLNYLRRIKKRTWRLYIIFTCHRSENNGLVGAVQMRCAILFLGLFFFCASTKMLEDLLSCMY